MTPFCDGMLRVMLAENSAAITMVDNKYSTNIMASNIITGFTAYFLITLCLLIVEIIAITSQSVLLLYTQISFPETLLFYHELRFV